jgi:predicted RNase H-like HicB family nuclease
MRLSYHRNMPNEYTAVVKQEAGVWIGWIEEVPGVNCQEDTREELLESLRITLAEALEFNREDARQMAGTKFEEALIAA